MCDAGSDSPTGPRFGGRPGLELHNSRELLGLTTDDVSIGSGGGGAVFGSGFCWWFGFNICNIIFG